MDAVMVSLRVERAWYENSGIVIEDFSLTVHRNETVTVMGPSGAGKTTLLGIIAGLHRGFSGELITGGSAALMPQGESLLPFYTVMGNTLLLAKAAGRRPDLGAASALLEGLGLGGLERRYPAFLSGGQRRRAALAQALFREPDILLMDEPFGALDWDTKTDIIALVKAALTEKNIASVFVTHDRREAELMGGRLVTLSPSGKGGV